MILKRQSQTMAGAFPERKTASHLRPVNKRHLKEVEEDNLGLALWGKLSDQVGSYYRRLSRIDVLLALAPGGDPVFVHHAPHSILAPAQQHGQIAMPQGIV
jgi:hypothetical protein